LKAGHFVIAYWIDRVNDKITEG